jgi:hypothetical protein
MPAKIPQRIRQGMGRRPSDIGERVRRPARTESHKPVPAIGSRTEYRLHAPQRAERRDGVLYARIRNIAAHDRHPPARKPPEDPVHAYAEIAMSLTEYGHAGGNAQPAPVRCDCEHGSEPAVCRRCAQQRIHGLLMKPQGRAFADGRRKPTLHHSQPRRACEDHQHIVHDLRRRRS